VHLLFFLAAGQLRLGSVDDDDVIPRVDVRGVDAFVLALQQVRREAGHATDRVLSGIDDMPPALDPASGGDVRGHGTPSQGRSYPTANRKDKQVRSTCQRLTGAERYPPACPPDRKPGLDRASPGRRLDFGPRRWAGARAGRPNPDPGMPKRPSGAQPDPG